MDKCKFDTVFIGRGVIGLAIHLTLDLNGKARFGPNVSDCDATNYSVSLDFLENFYTPIRQYWPDIERDHLYPDYSGIRQKVSKNGNIATDCIIETEKEHGLDGAVNILNGESPGLTASLALAEYVSKFLNVEEALT